MEKIARINGHNKKWWIIYMNMLKSEINGDKSIQDLR
jgi:hypothetical protein